MMSTKELIQKIQKHPCLWDRCLNEYRDKYAKERAWNEICEELVPEFNALTSEIRLKIVHQVTKKWYNVRDSYAKSIRGSKKRKPYVYAEALSFLDPIYFETDTSKIEALDDHSDNSEDRKLDFDAEPFVNEVYLDVEDNDIIPAKMAKTSLNISKRNEEASSSNTDLIVSSFSSLIENERDEDRAFFNSILPTVKQLSSVKKFEFRIQVMNILKNLTKGFKQETDPMEGINEEDL